MEKRQKWSWGAEQVKAFQAAKEQLTLPKCLLHYDPQKALIVSGDVSPYGVGAVLAQMMRMDPSGQWLLHLGRCCCPKENMLKWKKEGLAIVFAVKKFHDYLLGRKFTIQSDHKLLQYLFSET